MVSDEAREAAASVRWANVIDDDDEVAKAFQSAIDAAENRGRAKGLREAAGRDVNELVDLLWDELERQAPGLVDLSEREDDTRVMVFDPINLRTLAAAILKLENEDG